MTAKEVEQLAKAPGKPVRRVEQGLYLQCKSGGVSWLGRYYRDGKEHWPGYGPYPEVSLAAARARRDADRTHVNAGGNPVIERRQVRAAQQAEERPRKKFKAFAMTYIGDHESEWKNPIHRKQWPQSLKAYAYPVIGDLWLDEISSEDAVKMLRPIWYEKYETAKRVRGRCEKIWDAARVLKLCAGDNPFRLAGNIGLLLPSERKRKRKVKHHPALAYARVPEFMTRLRAIDTTSAKALEFVVLTWVRTGDIIGQRGRDQDRPPMQWSHVDPDTQIWTIPATKTDVEHKVPLSDAAMAVLRSVKGLDPAIVFPSPDRRGQPLSNNAMLALLDRMGYGDVTVHGMRSSARDWASECTNFSNEVCEMALAHQIEDDAEAAYRRGELLVKRRHLMNAWAKYCDGVPVADVIALPIQREA